VIAVRDQALTAVYGDRKIGFAQSEVCRRSDPDDPFFLCHRRDARLCNGDISQAH
jgi:hypothetical protein